MLTLFSLLSPRWLACVCSTFVAVSMLVVASPAFAEKGKLRERLTPDVMAVVFPAGAERLGPEEGSPPAIAVYKGDKVVAYVFSTLDIIAAPGYSATPFDVIAGVDLDGRITGAKVVFHREPYVYHDPVRQPQLDTFLAREAGRPLRGGSQRMLPPDFVAGATISARAMRAAVHDTARLVLRARGRRTSRNGADPRRRSFQPEVVGRTDRRGRGGAPARDFGRGRRGARQGRRRRRGRSMCRSASRTISTSSSSPACSRRAAIGGNLFGVRNFEEYQRHVPNGAHAIFVASNGPYDFLGTSYFRGVRRPSLRPPAHRAGRTRPSASCRTIISCSTGAAEGFQWPAERRAVRTARERRLRSGQAVAAGAPGHATRAGHAARRRSPLRSTTSFPRASRMPRRRRRSAAEARPVGRGLAAMRATNVAILAALLVAAHAIFIFQAQLSRSRLAHRLVRTGFLLVVLVWLGWTAGAQLSIVNVINYVQAPFSGFDIGFYLAEPLMVIIAAYTLVSLMLIGRGVFCGWLCPFGALQELLGQVSRALRVPQWNPSPALEKRLWMGKYIAAAAGAGAGADRRSIRRARRTEIEPFKTAITSKFTRAWPYVIYAGALLAIGLFSERAYCRFLCPLGGVLAALDRLHLIDLLKRRPECGNPCHLCERSCPVRAIVPTGKIVTAECFQCLDCQVEYYDDKRCPPLVQAAKLRPQVTPA